MKKQPQLETRRGFMFVLSSPSGAGKTTLSRLLLESDDNLVMSVSATTRPKREKEKNMVDYHFVTEDVFHQMLEEDGLLEHANVFGHLYGTPRREVEHNLELGKDVIFDIDWQGTEQLSEKARKDLVSIFILPPSMQELENRLRKRGEDAEEVIAYRMEKANNEISHWQAYDYVLVNQDVDDSLERIKSILQAERLKRERQQGLPAFVEKLIG